MSLVTFAPTEAMQVTLRPRVYKVDIGKVGFQGPPGLPGTAAATASTLAGLGTPTAGEIRRVTDDVRGLWYANGFDWISLVGEVVNVKEFGAQGDGITDDSAAIQAAIDSFAASSAGGVVVFPRGVYRIVSEIIVTGNHWGMKFVGLGGHMHRYSNDTAADGGATLLIEGAITGFTFTGGAGTIDGGPIFESLNFDALVAEGKVAVGLAIQNANYWTVRDCTFQQLAAGLRVGSGGTSQDASWGMVDNCEFQENVVGVSVIADTTNGTPSILAFGGRFMNNVVGVDIAGASHFSRIIGPKFDVPATGIGIRLGDCTGTQLVGVVMEGDGSTASDPIYVLLGYNGGLSVGTSINGLKCFTHGGTKGIGVSVDSSGGDVLSLNIVDFTANGVSKGIYLDDVSGVNIMAAQITNSITGIDVTANAVDVTIYGLRTFLTTTPLANASTTTHLIEAPGSWVTATLATGWSAIAGLQAPRYRKVGDSVEIEGSARNTSGGDLATALFTLPAGFRPVAAQVSPAYGLWANSPYVDVGGGVTPNGNVADNGIVPVSFRFSIL